jgi:transposase InsO family protein
LKLPVFKAGAHVTAEMVVEALTPLLPLELKYLISDNGPQFIAQVFKGLAAQAQFIHVRIAPHRACTNGIAERFVQTLKGWLEKHTWHNDEELIKLIQKFRQFYNDRPHQGAELNGLSPNEYSRRLLNPCSTS